MRPRSWVSYDIKWIKLEETQAVVSRFCDPAEVYNLATVCENKMVLNYHSLHVYRCLITIRSRGPKSSRVKPLYQLCVWWPMILYLMQWHLFFKHFSRHSRPGAHSHTLHKAPHTFLKGKYYHLLIWYKIITIDTCSLYT